MWKRPLQKENINAKQLIAYRFISGSHMIKKWCYRHCLYHFWYISIFRRRQEISLEFICRKYNASKCLAFWSPRFIIPSIVWKTIFRRQSVKYHIAYPWILTFLTSKSLSDIIYSHHSIEIFSGVLLQYMMLIILQGIIIYFCLCKGKLYSCTDKEQ